VIFFVVGVLSTLHLQRKHTNQEDYLAYITGHHTTQTEITVAAGPCQRSHSMVFHSIFHVSHCYAAAGKQRDHVFYVQSNQRQYHESLVELAG
jgi:hypothetical protein